ncbi:MAG: hypothetical protein J5865_02250 [Lachnospiraceae bacterium]|nr:hypothetical protein [Lachnospiraceae bacterium]
MKEISLNKELTMDCPQGFYHMTEAEKRAMNTLGSGQWIGLNDPERHILVTAGWNRPGLLAKLFLNDRDLAKNMEKRIRKAMKDMDYRMEGFKERTVAGLPAGGFRYGYRARNTDMTAESYVLKKGKTIYYFHVYLRSALKEESFPVWEEILDSVR